MRFFSHSISRKILASFMGIYLVTYLLTAAVVFTGVRTSIIDAETKALSEQANSKIERLINIFRLNAINLKAWSELDVMNDLITGDIDKRVARTLETLKRQYQLEGEIYAFNTQGALVASSTPDSLPRDQIKEIPKAWVPPVSGPLFIDKHPNPYGKDDIVAFAIPVAASFSKEYSIGAMVMTYPWNAVEDHLFDNALSIALIKISSGGTVLASNKLRIDQELPIVNVDGQITLGNRDYIVGRSFSNDSALTDWQVMTLRQTSDAMRSVRKVAVQLMSLGLFLGAPVLMGALWLAKKLTRPVEELTAYVQVIGNTGNLGKRIGVSSDDELGILAQSFNHMTDRLDKSSQERDRVVHELENLTHTLEEKVLERTLELENANQVLTKAFDDLKAAQGQLVQAEKMASLGQLVAGVAHELNNPIAFMYANFPHLESYVRTLLDLIDAMRKAATFPEISERLEGLVAEAEIDYIRDDVLKIIRSGKDGAARVKEIVLSLRSFSRLDEAEFKDVLLEDGINATLAILHYHLKGRITVERDFQLVQTVPCFPGQINQVFMNIIFNAIQAIKNEGTIRISTRADGPWALVQIEDSGPGIPQEIMDKIFDPFFTTKKVGEGTGLGLSISYGIMEKHGGNISVRSEVGKGTAFELRLPLNAVSMTKKGAA